MRHNNKQPQHMKKLMHKNWAAVSRLLTYIFMCTQDFIYIDIPPTFVRFISWNYCKSTEKCYCIESMATMIFFSLSLEHLKRIDIFLFDSVSTANAGTGNAFIENSHIQQHKYKYFILFLTVIFYNFIECYARMHGWMTLQQAFLSLSKSRPNRVSSSPFLSEIKNHSKSKSNQLNDIDDGEREKKSHVPFAYRRFVSEIGRLHFYQKIKITCVYMYTNTAGMKPFINSRASKKYVFRLGERNWKKKYIQKNI